MFFNLQESKTLISTLLAGQAGIYMLLNRINGKYYIGSSVNLADRMKRHIYGTSSNAHLQSATDVVVEVWSLKLFSYYSRFLLPY
jgi:predicted GIY-YIG superfamily endonuclease